MTTARETDHAPGEGAKTVDDTTPLSVDQLRAAASGPVRAVLDAANAAGSSVSRRQLMRGAAIAGTVVAAGAGLAACGSAGSSSYGASGSSGSTSGATQPSSTMGSGSSPSTSAAASGGSGSMGTEIASTSQIPVGGGVVFADQKVVVTQPTAGTFKAFSSTCTHAGCTVNKVADGLIDCPCHGSKFSVTTGAVKAGPAPSPLPEQNITMQGDKLYVNT